MYELFAITAIVAGLGFLVGRATSPRRKLWNGKQYAFHEEVRIERVEAPVSHDRPFKVEGVYGSGMFQAVSMNMHHECHLGEPSFHKPMDPRRVIDRRIHLTIEAIAVGDVIYQVPMEKPK